MSKVNASAAIRQVNRKAVRATSEIVIEFAVKLPRPEPPPAD
jgi:hypothetical protein